jgi:16S rRNA (guanine527-N7)-methyltransferase
MFYVEQALFVDVLVEATSTFGIKLENEQLTALTVYYRELDRWGRKVSLTALRDPKEIAIKHFLDSLLFSQALKQPIQGSLLDVGSGAGFPGLPLKILAPGLQVTLLEPNAKKTAFLRHVIGTIALTDVAAVSRNLREFSQAEENLGRFSYVTTRALALPRVLPFCRALLIEHGRVVVSLGKTLAFDPVHYGLRISRVYEYELPCGFGHRVLAALEQIAET